MIDLKTTALLTEDRSGILVGISIAFIIITTLAAGLRIWAKRFQGGRFYADDALLLLAYILNLGMCAVGIRESCFVLDTPNTNRHGGLTNWYT